MENYSYPINPDWSKEEMYTVISFFNAVESAYEAGIHVDDFKKSYADFKEVIRSKSEEKQLGSKFEDLSGYSIYRTVQEMKARSNDPSKSKKAQLIKMSK